MAFLEDFCFPLLAEQIEDGESIADEVSDAAFQLRANNAKSKLLSSGWSEGLRAKSKDDYDEYGYTSHGSDPIVGDERFHRIHTAIVEQCQKYTKLVGSDPRFHIMNSWVSIYGNGHYVPEHIHTHAHLSCVFYARASEGTGHIVFRNPAHAVYAMSYGKGDPFFSDRIEIPPKKGMLIIFPSFMPHYTKPHVSDEYRVILSANMAFDAEC